MLLEGRVAVVTGGGRGIGAATARALAEAGAAVVVSARSVDEIDRIAGVLQDAGHRVAAIPCDVTDADAVRALAAKASDVAGPIDVLINNAGVSGSSPFDRQSLEEWNRFLAVNATGAFLCMQAFLPGMVTKGWGRVVNIASVAGLTGAKYIAAYTASKHALVGLTRSVAAEVADRGVTVNAICPGYVDTAMTEASVRRIADKTGRSPEDALAAIVSRSPQQRLIQPSEVAHAVLALCADSAGGVNGQTLVIDGGGVQG